MSGWWKQVSGAPSGRWSFWKFNWLANHKILRALEQVRHHAQGDLLDIGCGSKPFAHVLEGRIRRYWGTDLTASPYLGGARLDAYATAEAQPFRDASFDTALGLSMITYLPEPLRFLREVRRVLKPGGMLLLECTQMVPLHDEPHDYFRYTRYGAAYLMEQAGFEPVAFVPIGGLGSRVGLTLIAALNRLNRGPTRILTELPVRLLYVIIQLAAEGMDRLFGDEREVLATLVVARRRP